MVIVALVIVLVVSLIVELVVVASQHVDASRPFPMMLCGSAFGT